MAPHQSVSKLKLYVAAREGTPAGGEDAVVGEMRRRLNLGPRELSMEQTRQFFRHGIQPVAMYLQRSTTNFLNLRREDRAKVLYEAFKACAHRTRLMARFTEVLDSDVEWERFGRDLEGYVTATSPWPSAPSADALAPANPAPQVRTPLWAQRWCYAPSIIVLSVAYGYVWQYAVLGRSRITSAAPAFLGGVICLALLWYGPNSLPGTCYTVTEAKSGDEPEEDGDGESEVSSASGWSAPAAQTSVSAAEHRMQEAAAGSGTPATATFLGRTDPPGAFGVAPAAVLPFPHTPEAVPQVAAAGAAHVWAPMQELSRGSAQAKFVLNLLQQHESQRTLNPYWGAGFWKDVHAFSISTPFTADLARLLSTHGYFGEGSISPPRDQLKGELTNFSQMGVPMHGASAAAVTPQQAPGFGDMMAQGRWQHQLPPDLKRAAPEIYRNLRSQGVASAREWVDRNYTGNRTGPEWVDTWHSASEIDFVLGPLRSDAEIYHTLAVSDGLEMKLRKLSAFLYENRTGDRAGAAHMLAVAVPGHQTDLAPTWMVTDVTDHSKREHQRVQRVAAERRGFRGRGDGRARGGRGEGDGRGGGGTGGDGAADGAAGDGGRGRGRGRRGGGKN